MSYRSSPPLYAMSRRSRAPPSRLELPRPRIWPNLARSRGESSDNESSNKPLRRRAEDGFIDLTRELTPSPPRSLGPHGTSPYANGDARTLKRRRLDGEMRHREPTQEPIASSSTQQTRNAYEVDLTGDLDFEEVDMTGVDDEIGLRRIQNAQRERHEMQNKVHEKQNQLLKDSVQAQTTESKGPIRLGQLQCVICLENMTNITATHCGKSGVFALVGRLISDGHHRPPLLPHLHHGSSHCWRTTKCCRGSQQTFCEMSGV